MPLAFIIICAVGITFSNEIIARQGIGFFNWICKNIKFTILNVFIHTAFLSLLYGSMGNLLAAGVICQFIFYALASVSFFKYAARNEVLYTSDFTLFFKVMSVSDKSNIYITKYNVIALLLNIFSLFTLILLPKPSLSTELRLGLCAAGFIIIFFILLYIRRNNENDFTYFIKGFSLGFFSNVYLYFTECMSEPEKPGEKKAIFYEPKKTPELKPTVIAVLSESFWDIEKMPGLKFSENVIPNFKKLTESCTHGSLVVTPFGGGTCNVESELLTGAPIRYFNISNSFYHRYITHPITSLPRIFCQNGYETIALHTFDKDFYNRSTALSHMGFGSFKAKEDLINPVYEGKYIADSELTKMIIEAYEKRCSPAFIFGISMENHQPYGETKYAGNPIKLLNEDVNPQLKAISEAYAHGLHDADNELSALISYFEKVDEPVDIIFFGDHLGALGPLFSLYKKTGFISSQAKLNLEDIKKIFSTEFIIWSNYKKEKSFFPDTSSNFLGNIILNRLGLTKPELFYFMDEVYEKWHCVNRYDLVIDSYGKMYGNIPDKLLAMDEKYRHLARRTILSGL